MTHYLTKQGLQKIKEELEHMKQVTRKEIIERIAAAKELGDLKENAEYAEAKDEQALVESKILELETALKGAVLIEESHGNHSTVSVGSTVITQCDGSKFTYTIVGSEEADPLSHKISHESPLGKAFLGKKIGETVIVRVPKGDFAYSIVEIQ
jgi:transcription elongation factor GreA